MAATRRQLGRKMAATRPTEPLTNEKQIQKQWHSLVQVFSLQMNLSIHKLAELLLAWFEMDVNFLDCNWFNWRWNRPLIGRWKWRENAAVRSQQLRLKHLIDLMPVNSAWRGHFKAEPDTKSIQLIQLINESKIKRRTCYKNKRQEATDEANQKEMLTRRYVDWMPEEGRRSSHLPPSLPLSPSPSLSLSLSLWGDSWDSFWPGASWGTIIGFFLRIPVLILEVSKGG